MDIVIQMDLAIDSNIFLSSNQCLLIRHRITPWLPQFGAALVLIQNLWQESRVRNVQKLIYIYIFF